MIADSFSVALQLKSIGVERPDGHSTKLFIPTFGCLYGMIAIIGSVDHNALLKAAKRPTLRANQVFEKFHPPAHRKNFCGVRVLFKARLWTAPSVG
jgi:hypothetical protein